MEEEIFCAESGNTDLVFARKLGHILTHSYITRYERLSGAAPLPGSYPLNLLFLEVSVADWYGHFVRWWYSHTHTHTHTHIQAHTHTQSVGVRFSKETRLVPPRLEIVCTARIQYFGGKRERVAMDTMTRKKSRYMVKGHSRVLKDTKTTVKYLLRLHFTVTHVSIHTLFFFFASSLFVRSSHEQHTDILLWH